ncbi:MAG: hypothetical protein IJ247_05055 [Bacilli bacterium]|nr:hypothetical protein [Bacilli bacterium]
MKRMKHALGLIGLAASISSLAGCNGPTKDDKGGILTFVDDSGNVVSYTAEELLGDYEGSGTTASTYFDKLYEVLVRKYYNSPAKATELEDLKVKAKNLVLEDESNARQNANNNGTSYQTEFESILSSHKCENLNDLFEYHLYQKEKEAFENHYYNDNINAVRDGATNGLYSGEVAEENRIFPEDAEGYGIGNDGWIKEQMPYHFRHILVKVSASSGAFTQGQITEDSDATKGGEATKLSSVIFQLAGAVTSVTDNGDAAGTVRDTTWKSFGEIAVAQSEDESSAKNFGETSIVTKVMSSDFVPEFKLGTYAFDSLYNKTYTGENATTWAKENIFRVTPGLKDDATEVSEENIDPTQTVIKADGSEETIYNYFKEDIGLGQIPYGAAVALYKAAKVTKDSEGNPVNDGNAIYYPRNILFNKYFNKHNICVITPNEVPYNLYDGGSLPSTFSSDFEDEKGTVSDVYKALPGFQNDNKDVTGLSENVLSNSEGQIVLAVRAGASSYQGIHFIVVQRDALSLYGSTYDKEAKKVTENTASNKEESGTNYKSNTVDLNDYYSTTRPGLEGYPTYGEDKTAATTYVNYNQTSQSEWQTRSGTITTDLKNYNSSLSTYIFQNLVKEQKIVFNSAAIEAKIKNYTSENRKNTKADHFNTWANNWKTYAEMIQAQEEARNLGKGTGKGTLISEYCAIGYKNHDGAAWEKGGVCYHAK